MERERRRERIETYVSMRDDCFKSCQKNDCTNIISLFINDAFYWNWVEDTCIHLRPCPMVCLIALSTRNGAPMGSWMLLKDDMEEGSVEHIQQDWTGCHRTRGRNRLAKLGACATRADRRAWGAGEAEREDSLRIMDDTWLILIGCLDFYHLNNFNSYISLEINLKKNKKYQNSWFFFL